MRGLLGRKSLAESEGLLLTPAAAIHTWFMRFPIDVVFLDSDLTVLGVRARLQPWRATGWRNARAVLELAAGQAARHGIRPGDRLSLTDAHDEHVKVLLFFGDRRRGRRVAVDGRGSLSAAARTVDAIGSLDVPVSIVVMPDEHHSAA
jgi:uncharacterized membrane protein (UPF0127 family)